MLQHATPDRIATGASPGYRLDEAVAQSGSRGETELLARFHRRAKPAARPIPVARRRQCDRGRVAGKLVYQLRQIEDRRLNTGRKVVRLARNAAFRSEERRVGKECRSRW